MTLEELSKYGINEVVSNHDLLSNFKELYKSKHGVYPSCSSCSIADEFRQLYQTHKQMENTFKYKSQGEILTYTNDKGKKIRIYDTNLTEEFVQGYLTPNKFTSAEEIEDRKKNFKKLPDFITNPTSPEETTEVTETPQPIKKPSKKRASKKK